MKAIKNRSKEQSLQPPVVPGRWRACSELQRLFTAGQGLSLPLLSAALLHHLRQQQSCTAQGCALGQGVMAHWLPGVLGYKGNN